MLAQYPGSTQPAVNQSPPDVCATSGGLDQTLVDSDQGFLQPSVGSGPGTGSGIPFEKSNSVRRST